jgi:hypothetical protein
VSVSPLYVHSMAKAPDLNLIKRITSLLENKSTPPWFPELSDELVQVGWQALHHITGLTVHNYGTARVLSRDAKALRQVVAHLSTYSETKDCRSIIPIESLAEVFIHTYEEDGISFYTADEIVNTKVFNSAIGAMGILNQVPTLASSVAPLVRAFHALKLADDEYDVSFSEPHLPFSIFVSIPQKSSVQAKLRVAEAIVHESMHLQLSLIEMAVPLVVPNGKKYFSPWKGEYRFPQDVLHALYVFRVVNRFLEELMSTTTFEGEAHYIHKRHNQIAAEIEQVRSFQECSNLTPVGVKLVQSLLTC